MDKHRFNVGDVITSSKNKKIKYLIKEVGVKNELGELDYVVEDISDDERFNGKVRRISIGKADTWGVLVMWGDEKKELKKIEEKSAWTEEDEKFFKTALWHISYSITNGENTDCKCDTTEWLKHLKERIKGG